MAWAARTGARPLRRQRISASDARFDLVVDEPLELLAAELLVRVVEAEERTRDRGRGRLVFRVVVRLEVGVREGVLDGDALLWIEGETLLEQVDRERVGVRIQRCKRLPLLERQRAKIITRAVGRNLVEVVEVGRAEDVKDAGTSDRRRRPRTE